MACGPCGAQGKGVVEEMRRMEISYPRADGSFFLGSFPDCEGGHHGKYEGLSIYVVARGTERERLFPPEGLGDAADYSNLLRVEGSPYPIEKLSTASLCDAAVVDLMEGRLTYA